MGFIDWIRSMLDRLLFYCLRPTLGSSSQSAAPGPAAPIDVGTYSILDILKRVQERIQATMGSSSQSAHEVVPLPRLHEVNEYIYEVRKSAESDCRPEAWRPSVEIVFFHGLQLENSKDAHIDTWVSRDKKELWLNWLFEDFPDARILTISYDAFAKTTGGHGNTKMHITSENLVSSLTGSEAGVGQDGCPLVLVGHCLGGLVMKELCLQASHILNIQRQDKRDERVQNLLDNMKGVFYYACPNHGSRLADEKKDSWKGPLFEGMTTLNKESARRNEDFRKLREKHGWKSSGLGESRRVTLGNFTGIIVPDASARQDVDSFYTVDADHFNVCRPDRRISASYKQLSQFVAGVLKEDKARFSPKTSLPTELIGLEGNVKIVEKKLRGAQRLGIVGFGGIGKTTLAKVVYEKVHGSYEYACFLDDVKNSMAREVKPVDLQAEIVRKLYCRGRKVADGFHWDTLKMKRVLIVLDDVECESQVEVMTASDGFAKESRVIVTSRDSGFLIPQDFELHKMGSLGFDDSKRLFCLHAFKKTLAPQAYEDRVAKFVEKCGGLPLALKVAGRYLYNRKEAMWDDGFEKLSLAQPLNGKDEDGLWSILRTCYESLATQEKEMFKDVATCFHGERLEDVQKAWRACSWASSDCGWENLLDRCLVEERSDDDGVRWIWMHEVLRDLGRSIAGHTRVFDIKEANRLLHQGHVEMQILKISNSHMSECHPPLDINVMFGLNQLEILWLEEIEVSQMKGSHPSSFDKSHISTLRCLKFNYCVTLKTLPYNFRMLRALKHLEIWACMILQALPDTLGNLGALKHLEIQECSSLQALPDTLGNLGALQHLEIVWCESLQALPDTLGNLGALQHLEIQGCKSLQALPDTLGNLGALQHLEIAACESLQALPDTLGNLGALQHLEIQGCKSLQALPDTLGNLGALQHLGIGCKSLQALPDTLGNLGALQHLEIQGCKSLQALPDTLGNLGALQHLGIGCKSLQALPDTLGNLGALQHLEIAWCKSLQALPNTLGNLGALQHLEIAWCESLQALPDTLGNLGALQHLEIQACWSLQALPDTLGNLGALQHLEIQGCKSLQALPDTLGNLGALQHLEIQGCKSLQALPDTLGNLGALQHLEIAACESLQALPDTLGNLGALQHLEIQGCKSLQALPDTLGNLGALQHLGIGCKSLQALPDTLGNLGALQHLEIQGCKSLQALPDTLGNLGALQHLGIGCKSLQALPDTLGNLGALQHLEIAWCKSLQALPNTLGNLGALQHLEIAWCESLQALPDTLGNLGALQHLEIQACWSLQALPDTLGNLGALQHLEIQGCKSLQALPDTLGNLGALQHLEIQGCKSLQALPDTLGNLGALQHLEIAACESLQALPDTLGNLGALQHLEIQGCKSLQALPDTLGNLGALQHLGIGCKSLQALPDTLGNLGELQHLKIAGCLSLQALPDTLWNLGALQHLEIAWCKSLQALPDTLGNLGALQHLEIVWCESLQALPDTLGNLGALQLLEISGSGFLQALPDSLGDLGVLQYLRISCCESLQALPNTLGNLGALQHLIIKDCKSLEALPDTLGDFFPTPWGTWRH